MKIGNDMIEHEMTLREIWNEMIPRRTLMHSAISTVVAIGVVALFSFNGIYA